MSTVVNVASRARSGQTAFAIAWGFCLVFYFAQYALRSAPGVMIPELTATFGLSALGITRCSASTITPIRRFRLSPERRWTASARNTSYQPASFFWRSAPFCSDWAPLGRRSWGDCCKAPGPPSRSPARST